MALTFEFGLALGPIGKGKLDLTPNAAETLELARVDIALGQATAVGHVLVGATVAKVPCKKVNFSQTGDAKYSGTR